VILRFGGLAIIDAAAIYFAYNLAQQRVPLAAGILIAITVVINWVYLDERLFPIRWLAPGLTMMILMVIYPLVYSIFIALTNFSDGHLLSEDQVVNLLSRQYYAPASAITFEWTAYRSSDSQYQIVLKDTSGKYFLGSNDQEVQPYNPPGGQLPPTIEQDNKTYKQLTKIESLKYLGDLTKITMKSGDNLVRINGLDKASEQLAKYSYDSSTGVLTDKQTGKTYTAQQGTFVDAQGKALEGVPGFTAVVGLQNYQRVLTDPNIRKPFFGVFLWTIIFAFLSVALTFAVGLGLALVLNDDKLPFRSVFRSLTIIPYTIPAVISVLIWVGLMNPIYGQFSLMLKSIFGSAPPFFSNGTWA